MNQQDSNRKFNPDNIPPKGDDSQKKKSKLNIYWMYGIFLVVLIGWQLFRNVSSAGVETDQQKFYEMVKMGDVEKIKTIRNKKIVRVFINKDSLTNKPAQYKAWLTEKPDDKKYETAQKVRIGSRSGGRLD